MLMNNTHEVITHKSRIDGRSESLATEKLYPPILPKVGMKKSMSSRNYHGSINHSSFSPHGRRSSVSSLNNTPMIQQPRMKHTIFNKSSSDLKILDAQSLNESPDLIA